MYLCVGVSGHVFLCLGYRFCPFLRFFYWILELFWQRGNLFVFHFIALTYVYWCPARFHIKWCSCRLVVARRVHWESTGCSYISDHLRSPWFLVKFVWPNLQFSLLCFVRHRLGFHHLFFVIALLFFFDLRLLDITLVFFKLFLRRIQTTRFVINL
jgi:hypothetical protein